jgi:hypothetical protein
MNRLLFHLAQLECVHASWVLAAGDMDGTVRRVERASILLDAAQTDWPERWTTRIAASDRIVSN